MSKVNISAYVRGLLRGQFSEGFDTVPQLSSGGEQFVAQALPPELELARQGALWVVVGSSVTAVAAVPTTAAHLSLYNAGPSKSLVIHAVGGFTGTSAGVFTQFTMMARNDTPGANNNPYGSVIISGTSGKMYPGGLYAGANAKASVTLAAIGAANNVAWIPVCQSSNAATVTTVGLTAHAELAGRFIVQPLGLFSLASVAATAAGGILPYIVFSEVLLPLP